MSVTAKCLVETGYMPNSLTTIYTAPASTRTIIDAFTIANVDSASHTFAVYLVPSGQTAGPSNLLFPSLTVSGGGFLNTTFSNQILNAGDFIAAQASAANFLVQRMSGRECT